MQNFRFAGFQIGNRSNFSCVYTVEVINQSPFPGVQVLIREAILYHRVNDMLVIMNSIEP